MRGKVADVREARYGLDHEDGGCYLFRMDADNVVDATKIGSIARFINHSCNPNSYSKVVTVDKGVKKIIIFAKRAIRKGDELVYDYQVREWARERAREWAREGAKEWAREWVREWVREEEMKGGVKVSQGGGEGGGGVRGAKKDRKRVG